MFGQVLGDTVGTFCGGVDDVLGKVVGGLEAQQPIRNL